MPGGAFTPEVRAAIFDAHLGACIGCGRKATDTHHRAARRAGGTSNAAVGAPYNGVGLDRVCHMWAEAHPDRARRLGWILARPDPTAPYWTHYLGWCSWVLLTDGPPCWCVRPCLPLDPPPKEVLP